jgi:hypothetical protein
MNSKIKANTPKSTTEKQKLVDQIIALQPKADKVVLLAQSRDSLRETLRKVKDAAANPEPEPAKPAAKKAAGKAPAKGKAAPAKQEQAPEPAAAQPEPAPTPAPQPAPVAESKRYVSKTPPDSKYHLRDRSAVESPVTVVRNICNANIGKPRKDIVALCIAAGVNKNTAATQYSFWKTKYEAEHGPLPTSK